MNPDKLITRLLPTLYEDEHLLAVAKPAGVDSGGLEEQTWDGLVELLPAVRGKKERLVAANRLSRYESGVLILAKNETAANAIRVQIRASRVAQEYVAVVLGRMSKSSLTIGLEHGASEGRRGAARREVVRSASAKAAAVKARSTVAPRPGGAGASGGSTTLSALRAGEKRTLLRILTRVPTTHALRAQLRSIRLRLLGDLIQNQTNRPMRHAMTCLHLTRIGFQHPVTKKPISLHCPPPPAFADVVEGGADPLRPLYAALVRRLPCFASGESGEPKETDALRLLSGDVEDVRGVIAEKFGDVVILQVLREGAASMPLLKQYAKWYRDWIGARTVYAKWNVRDRSDSSEGPRPRSDEESDGATLLLGKESAQEFEIRENGIRFLVRPAEQAVGLFLDQRENRARIRENAAGKDVLNLFAYTCGFSLAAAVGGARSTVSVDLSPQPLGWGRANFDLNEINVGTHEFLQGEAFEFLRRARDAARSFDVVVLDPPTFAHGRRKQRDFSVRRDLGELVAASAAVLRPGGVMLVSTNLRSFTLAAIRDQIRRGVSRRRFEVLETPSLPPDFAVDPDHAKTVLLRFG